MLEIEKLHPNQIIDLKELINRPEWNSYRHFLIVLEQQAAKMVVESTLDNFIENKARLKAITNIRELTDSLHSKLEELKEREIENVNEIEGYSIESRESRQFGVIGGSNPADDYPRESAY